MANTIYDTDYMVFSTYVYMHVYGCVQVQIILARGYFAASLFYQHSHFNTHVSCEVGGGCYSPESKLYAIEISEM